MLTNVIEEHVATRFNPEDGNTTFLQNVCNQVLDNTVLQNTHTDTQRESPSLRKFQNPEPVCHAFKLLKIT